MKGRPKPNVSKIKLEDGEEKIPTLRGQSSHFIDGSPNEGAS